MAETSTIFGFMKYVSATDILSDFKKTVDSHFVNSLRWQYCHPFFCPDGSGFYCLYCFCFSYLDIVLLDSNNCCPTASHFVCQLYSSKSTIRRNCKGGK